jgi:hypothetical protein
MTRSEVLTHTTPEYQAFTAMGVAVLDPQKISDLDLIACAIQGARMEKCCAPSTTWSLVERGKLRLMVLGLVDDAFIPHCQVG